MTSVFPYHGAHRDLHSFPTRRSSDLAAKARWRAALPCIGGSTGARRPMHGKDRKSTRLNSSHAKISYAVFLLEKKRGLLLVALPLLVARHSFGLYMEIRADLKDFVRA